jgi:hypothetical protein
MLYLDTPLIVAALQRSDDAARPGLARGEDAGQLLISDWTVTGMSSALAIKLRTDRHEAFGTCLRGQGFRRARHSSWKPASS